MQAWSEESAEQSTPPLAQATYSVDLNGAVTFADSMCAQMLGYDAPEDLLGRNIHQLAHHTRVDGSEYPFTDCRIIVACSAGKETYVNDEVFWRADGTSVPVEYWAQPVERDGAVVGAVVRFVERKSAGIAPAIG